MNGWTMDERMNGWGDERMNGWTVEDERMNEADERMNESLVHDVMPVVSLAGSQMAFSVASYVRPILKIV